MAKEYARCKQCGAQKELFATNRAAAISKKEWWERTNPICSTCVGKAEFEEAKIKAEELELPKLKGTSAQIELAQRIRVPRIAELAELLERAANETRQPGKLNLYTPIERVLEDIHQLGRATVEEALSRLARVSNAAWWVQEGKADSYNLLSLMIKKVREEAKPENDKDLNKQVELEALIYPETQKSGLVAEFFLPKTTDTWFAVTFPERNFEFNDAIKLFGAKWATSRWVMNGLTDRDDRAAEVAHHLVSAGFIVKILNNEVREKVVSKSFSTTDGRVIDVINGEKLAIKWRRIDGDFYEDARKLEGSKWDRDAQAVVVPVTMADDVRDFAEKFGFPFSDAAKEAVEKYDEFRRTGMLKNGQKREPAAVQAKTLGAENIGKVAPELLDD